MRILVTGGAGFIGSHIAKYFHDMGHVRVLDNLKTGDVKNLRGLNVDFILGDVRDRKIVRKALEGVDYVFHFAAMVSVFESIDNPKECEDININGTLILLEEAEKAGVKKFCFSSSCAVYGDSSINPKEETMIPEPKSPYAESKLAGENLCNTFKQQNRLNTVCLRYFNVFGPGQSPENEYAAVIPIFLSQAIKNESLNIYGDGEQTRDFIYVDDVVAANAYFAMQKELSGVYNVGCGKQISINDLASKILEATNSSSSILYHDAREGDIKHSVGSVDKLLSAGFQFKSDFEKGLSKTIDGFYQSDSGKNTD